MILCGSIMHWAMTWSVVAWSGLVPVFEIIELSFFHWVTLFKAFSGTVKISRYRRKRIHYNVKWRRKRSKRHYRLRYYKWDRKKGKSVIPKSSKSKICDFEYHIQEACAMSSEMYGSGRKIAKFDTDSYPIKVDNCATRSISPHIKDFVDVPVKCRRYPGLKGINGNISEIYRGTIRWYIPDDTGKVHEITLPDSFYIPKARSRLLSPQHWAQIARDHRPRRRGTWSGTYDDAIELYWQQRKYTLTVPLDPESTNTGTIFSAPGFESFHASCTEIDEPIDGKKEKNAVAEPAQVICYDGNLVSDSEDEEQDDQDGDSESIVSDDPVDNQPDTLERKTPLVTDFDLNGPKNGKEPPVVVEDEEDKIENPSSELLMWHHRFGHISMAKLQIMAEQGILPKRLATCRKPLCTSCLFSKATRRP